MGSDGGHDKGNLMDGHKKVATCASLWEPNELISAACQSLVMC